MVQLDRDIPNLQDPDGSAGQRYSKPWEQRQPRCRVSRRTAWLVDVRSSGKCQRTFSDFFHKHWDWEWRDASVAKSTAALADDQVPVPALTWFNCPWFHLQGI